MTESASRSSHLSQSQLGVYLATAYNPEIKYHVALLLRFNYDISESVLAHALEKIVACHPMMRCRIEADADGEPVMALYDSDGPAITTETMTESELDTVAAAVTEHIAVPGGSLYRFRIIRTERGVRLYILLHHIVGDGASTNVILDDLMKALRGGHIEPEYVSGFEIADNEARLRQSEQFEEEKRYYTAEFGDYDSEGDTIYIDGDGGTPAVAQRTFRLSVTPDRFEGGSIAANAAMGIALGAFTGRDDVVFSTIFHGRDKTTARTVTMMVRTLPVRCRMGKDVTLGQLFDSLDSQRRETRARGVFSFGDFITMTGLKQNVLFGYQGRFLDPLHNLEGIDGETLNPGDTDLPLTVMFTIRETEIELDVMWRTDIYSEKTVERFVDTFDLALSQVCDAPRDTPMTSFRLVGDEAAERLKSMEKAPALDFDRTVPIEGAIARVATAMPGHTAVVSGDIQLTYADLDRRSSIYAARLRDMGIGAGATVGVMLARSEWMTLLPLAIMKTGAAYMPLDPTFPEERLLFMLEDAGVRDIITVDRLAVEKLPSFTGTITDAADLDAQSDKTVTPPAPESYGANGDSPFVVLYTSGSTGKPKGVTLTRANLLNFCHDYIALASLGADDHVAGYANFGFDAHMMDIYPTLMAGATLYILDEEQRHDLDTLHTFFEDNGISATFLTTQIAWQLTSLYTFTHMHWLACGGEKLPPVGPMPFTFANLYGPTECSVIATCLRSRGDIDGTLIGRPIAGYEIRILDKSARRVPQGAPGELVIHGPGVALGYLNRPELTAEKFITIDGTPAYRTGDLARWTEGGDLQFMGRMDGMVKLRGLRIELGEIEAVATRHPAVRQFAAAVKNVAGNEQLVGYYAVKDGAVLEPDELRGFMSHDLTEFMIPAAIVRLDALPLTPNGKTDRKALPVPELEASEEIVAPSTPEETEAFALVAEVLGHDSFGVTTNLLRVGLTSLLTMRLAASIAKNKGVRVTSAAIMKSPTVRGIAEAIAANATGSAATASAPRAARKYYPITENQRGVLIDWEMNRDALQYNVPQMIRIKPDTSVGRLREALAATVAAHPALGARFVSHKGDIMQQRVDGITVEVPEIVLDHTPSREEMQAMLRPFDLYGELLFRFAIVRCPDAAWLLMDFHHIVFDGVSAGVFFDSLNRAYAGEALQPEEYTPFDHAVDEAELMLSEQYDEAAKWFAGLLGGFETTSWPHSTGREDVAPGTAERVSCEADAGAIDRFCRDNALTASNYFLSVFMQTLHRVTRGEKIAITTVDNGRDDTRLIDDIGMFVRTLPVVSEIKHADVGRITPAQMALEMQRQFNTTRSYGYYPFTEIVNRYDIRPEIMYVYEGGVSMDAGDGPLSDEKIPLALDTAKVPLTLLIFTPAPGRYRLELEYDASLYSREDMTVLLDMICAAVVKTPSCHSIAEATLLSPKADERLAGMRCGVSGDVEFTSYHGALEQQVDRTPDATALIARDRTLTFGGLDREANRIANALRARGVVTGDKVVVLMPRDSRLITAIYGIMKAGAAYIPCDPDYPVERIRLITEDSDARLIVTTEDRVEPFTGKGVTYTELSQERDDSRPGVTVSADDPAYLIYTSGSTGRPKGVVIHHGAAANYLYGYRELIYRPMGADEPRVNMLIVTISFDASHVDLGTSLTSGHTLVLADEEECRDVTLLADLMKRTGVEAFDATPSRLAAMLELPGFRESISSCRLLNIGGEALTSSLITKLDDAGFRGLVVNEYGPTETTVGSNHAIVRSGMPVTVGRPFYNYKEYIVDAWGGELPVGAVGELVISGRSVGKGYHNLPEKTAESFITFNGERAYRTGDLGRWRADGDVDILGRIDHQVKLRGLRIELGEVESVATAFPGVKVAVANVRKIGNVDHLCLWYEGEDIDKAALLKHLESYLTDYMVPDSINPVDKIPVTPNGKLDRKNLPEPVLEALAEYVEPAPGTESSIAEAFRRTLGLDRVGANDDFFKIGGTSINAINVVAILSTDGIRVSYKDVFAAKTPRVLAAMLAGNSPAQAASAATEAQAAHDDRPKAFGDILDRNNLASFLDGTPQPLGNILLTGATGFLGVHVLHTLIENTTSHVTCVVRSSGSFSGSSRLRTLLFYYFGCTYEELWGDRITVVEGDLTEAETFGRIDAATVNTIINCAASVKHFAADDRIERINAGSVRNIVDWCLPTGKRLIHISTVSVAGEAEVSVAPSLCLTEQSFDLGQNRSNQYVSSKYNAEQIILEAIEQSGLNAKIIRVGNISPRAADGEFQANFQSNAFMGRLRAYLTLGCVPYDHLGSGCEFSPVDQLADAVIELAATPESNIIFHPLNNHRVPLGDVIAVMSEVLGRKIEYVENAEFDARLAGTLAGDAQKVEFLQPLLAYQSVDGSMAYIGSDSTFTTGILYRLGFRWSPTSTDYIRNFITAIDGLGYFDPA